ncbi:MAG: helix-turn-helix domain-containing protein [Acetobacter sp.]|nr:helix-turn-helix domain-containing protein [Bacteroides sp.]MCM1340380.1 helix-turn-helix domain-containing protein [Acetobacter sp.]MCM1432973.1 helix-turn-helix domain-containing protein [Clostridiales bacterium]
MSIDSALIGSRIRKFRKKAKLTQEKLAELMEVTPGYISQIELAKSAPNLETLAKLCAILDCDLYYVISGAIISENNYLMSEFDEKFLLLSDDHRQIVIDLIDVLLKH